MEAAMSRRGRRPAGADTKAQIVTAARAEFAANGYDGTSVRSIARRAGVDPGTVRHYFPDRVLLLLASMAPDGRAPADIARGVAAGGLEGLGLRLVTRVLETWDADGGVRFRVLISSLASDEQRVEVFADYLGQHVFSELATVIPGPDATLRVALAASQMAGVLMVRYVGRFEPIASMAAEDLARHVGPAVQRYFDGPMLSA